MNSLRIAPIDPPDAIVHVPGSRSITNRALICAALAPGASRIYGGLDAEDTQAMRRGLSSLGIAITEEDGALFVNGTGGVLNPSVPTIDCKASGTTMRFLSAIATRSRAEVTLDGTPRLRERPIGPLTHALRQLGAEISDSNGFPPVHIVPARLRATHVTVDATVSGQFVSALLMLAPTLSEEVRISGHSPVSRPFIDMTIEIMNAFGVTILREGSDLLFDASTEYQARDFAIEPDAMSASYFFAAAAVTGGCVTVEGLRRYSRQRQGDLAVLNVLEQMGCGVTETVRGVEVRGPHQLIGVEADLIDMPDMAPTVAVLACFANGPTTLTGVAHLRFKESDRLAALDTELSKLGATITVGESALRIDPPQHIQPATIDTYDDHRIAMSFAIAGLKATGITINDPACVAKTYPRFFDDLDQLRRTR
ncbi:MAG: 3-phosphoshikimate 1-carboxyvinyltransferase [Actinomycetota bacterium]